MHKFEIGDLVIFFNNRYTKYKIIAINDNGTINAQSCLYDNSIYRSMPIGSFRLDLVTKRKKVIKNLIDEI